MIRRERLEKLGISIPEILIPGKDVNPEKWSVIACDQFSSERSYWDEIAVEIDNAPSTLAMIIPECYLNDGNSEERVKRANESMKEYVDKGIMEELPPGFILVERSTPNSEKRKGLILALDLEAYDYSEGSISIIRPTEGTIVERLPPRMAVRREALLDLPHILILIDDPENRVMDAAEASAVNTVYDFDLIKGGGHVRGQFIPEEKSEEIISALENLASESELLFAVGDGNHSLAAAKEIWLEKKSDGAPPDHPARYALVEVENIYDPGLQFHPIHRVLFNVDTEDLTEYLKEALDPDVSGFAEGPGIIEFVLFGGKKFKWSVEVPEGRLAVESLQEALDAYLNDHPEAEIDYIHGKASVEKLVNESEGRAGIILPDIDKHTFFKRIIETGPYPRKTFSIGEAEEKRYYLEAKKLF